MYENVKLIPPLLGVWNQMPLYNASLQWEEDVASLEALAVANHWDLSIDFLKREMKKPFKTIVVTHINQNILYVSRYFEIMTGYSGEEVFGLKPDFLQGPDTNQSTVRRISKAISKPEKVNATLLNYKKNGAPYLCDIQIIPVFNHSQQLVNFLAIEQEQPAA